MRFSILIPVYNVEAYLSECLDSVVAQNFVDFEAIVIDDGSTDGSGAIADEYAAENPKIRVLHGENRGLLLARRKGLSHCKGEYVVFLDGDDRLLENALSEIDSAASEGCSDIVMYAFSRRSDGRRETARVSRLPEGCYKGDAYARVREYVLDGYMNSMWMKAVRRECFDLEADYSVYVGLMHGEDLLQTLPVIDRSCSLVMVDKVLYFYRPNEASSTARFGPSKLDDIARVNARLLEYGRKWGERFYVHALVGEATQYINLLCIIAFSDASRQEKLLQCDLVRAKMEETGAFERAEKACLRADHHVELRCLRVGKGDCAIRIIRSVKALKCLPGCR